MTLKERINEAGIKQKKVAEKIGLSPEHLNLLLNGKLDMPEDIRNKINDLLSKVAF